MNPYEDAARSRKVTALVDELHRLHRMALRQGLRCSDQTFAAFVHEMGETQKASLAVAAGTHPPNDETWAQVLEIMR